MNLLQLYPPGADQAAPTEGDAPTREVDPQWAWAEFQPGVERPWNRALAGHLYRRAGFGADWDTLTRALSEGPRVTIERLVRPPADVQVEEEAWDRDEDVTARTSGIESLRAWWLRRMIEARHPLREKMTLFWHGHCGVSHARVNSGPLMVRYIQTLRTHALGSYRALLDGVSREPAAFLAFGADMNRKALPNEQFSRQIMERLSVGPGHYGDEDVREAARAFTGWFVLQGRLKYLAHEHDAGIKRVFCQAGPWKPEDIVRIVLDQPAAPRLVVRRLFRWLISEVDEPSDMLIDPLARMLGPALDVGPVVETMLRSNLFFSEQAVRRRVKSPVEYALGIVQAFDKLVPTLPLGASLAQLGQDLYAPPTTRGWAGGTYWINAATLLGRQNLAAALLAPDGPLGGRLDPQALAERHGAGAPAAQCAFLVRLLLLEDDDSQAALADGLDDLAGTAARDALRRRTYQLVTRPEYQLC